ncbi:hypothetical protein PLUA15_350038 [Pseudomonas lundensis]|uniref:Transposase n=1 Tax=Pseudomonas lundensis TaxID=86185 RepID=A0AAX2HAF8_9PSED|nr:hypothetical protein PLUA15_350038 [Pseudomonas lundensis]
MHAFNAEGESAFEKSLRAACVNTAQRQHEQVMTPEKQIRYTPKPNKTPFNLIRSI